ncbi:MAG: DNA-directed RNA polymerase subunit K [Candidatus Korarchaeota archaeon]|nr:DNA-directed RNA polymerase subunit K [Candidatus Korarchaeota archaeon]NIU84157.1 DNA-directed RNA polymerase subunit K [Candidatus Thorarchaeota archaeon]NIW14302.1 DNA-directed RNA polymerase subunit K [Candidatus Thorarchaeota archaeon]NIW52399.1 DNA-directed RNA polymerase subunit K [Candidatus Korarchaeota archaeon]
MLKIDDIVEKLGDRRVKLGPTRLTIYEIARILGARSAQIAQGAPTLIEVEHKGEMDPLEIARKELKNNLLPITIHRVSPAGEVQIIPLRWLEFEENI